MLSRALSFALAVLLLCACTTGSTGAEGALNDQELAELLALAGQENAGSEDFVVLPEGYQTPAGGDFLVVPEGGQPQRGPASAGFRLLIIGVDTDNQALAGRSDTMILAQMDPAGGSVRLVSFMRDLYVSIPGHGHNRLNAAYSFGGPDLLLQTLEESFGLKVDGYLAVNFSLMTALVDAIGGIQVEVTAKELKSLNAILAYHNPQHGRPKREGELPASGYVTLTGSQALAYARIRKMDSDYQRVIRQQAVLGAVFQRMLEMDIMQLTGVLARFIAQVKTNITIAEGLVLLSDLLAISSARIDSLRIPAPGSGKSRTIRGMYFIVPDLTENRHAIQAFLGP
ncbi:MAG: LCP family protein [Eubacteriales bacterium]|nr:LCP family protein [Eubacteriales bacterium]